MNTRAITCAIATAVATSFPVRFGSSSASCHVRRHSCNPRGMASSQTTCSPESAGSEHATPSLRYLIYWRGEHKEGYSHSFRRWEFLSALSATIANTHPQTIASDLYNELTTTASFSNAFSFDPHKRGAPDMTPPSSTQVEMFNEAMQYCSFSPSSIDSIITPETISMATARCALIHSSYQVISDGMSYSELMDKSNNVLEPIFQKTSNNSDGITWSMKRHEHGFVDDDNTPRFGKRTTRSPQKEKDALLALKPLLSQFGGRVDLKNAECQVHLLEGLCDPPTNTNNDTTRPPKEEPLLKILSIRLATGSKHSTIAPKTRRCITTTPLCSISSHLLCNTAMIRTNQTVLDPFAGGGSTLLAAALLASVTTVGIELAPDRTVSRTHIREDFLSRGLTPPLAVLEGDAMDPRVRDQARGCIGGGFDVIVTDPPYGIRETMPMKGGCDGSSALVQLMVCMGRDRAVGRPLLKRGGRLVAFQPCRAGEDIRELLPSSDVLERSGLLLVDMREQTLNGGLSRWILSFSGC